MTRASFSTAMRALPVLTLIGALCVSAEARAADPAPPPVWPPGSGVTLTLESTPPGATFLVRSQQFAGWYWGRRAPHRAWLIRYAPLCVAPCSVQVPRGNFHLAMSTSDEGVADSRMTLRITGDTTVRGEYVSHQGTRTAGWITLGAGLGVGGFLLVSGFSQANRDHTNVGEVLAGTGIILGTAIVSAILIGTQDEARLTLGAALDRVTLLGRF